MANYRYKTAEIEAMKKDILTHCECETSPDRNGNKSAWRLRLILEGMAMCCRCSKREEARRYRKLALFERLTTNDMPNWLTEPTQPATTAEMPQISTETAEAVNVSAEGEKREETANIVEMQQHRKEIGEGYSDYTFYKFNDNIYAFGKEAELLREYFKNHKFAKLEWVEHRSNGIYYLRYHHSYQDSIKKFLKQKLNDKVIIGIWDSEEVYYWNRSRQQLKQADANEPIKHISEIIRGENIRLDDHEYYTWLMMAEDEPRRTIAEKALTEAWINILFATMRRGGHILAMNNCGKLVDTAFTPQTPEPFEKLEYLPQPPKIAPQSRKTTPTANYATPTSKAREIARKRHCRRLGVNGYAMLGDAAATLAAINTPQLLAANSPPYW